MKIRALCLMCILFFMGQSINAQSFRFKELNNKHGLSQNMINDILQDHQGYMWMGTKDGLNRYDGYTFKVYKSDPYDSTSISDNYITTMLEDDDHNLWIGTYSGGLHLYKKESDSFLQIRKDVLKGNDKRIRSITGNTKDGIWIATYYGNIYRLRIDKNAAKPDIQLVLRSSDLKISYIENILLDKNQTLWIVDRQKLIRFNIDTKDLDTNAQQYYQIPTDRHPHPQYFHHQPCIVEAFLDEDDNVWLYQREGLYKYNPKENNYNFYRIEGHIVGANVFKDPSGKPKIWTSSYFLEQIQIYDLTTHTSQYIPINEISQTDKFDGLIYMFYQSKDGTVWLGTNGRGLFLHSPEYSLFENGIPNELYNDNRSSPSIYSLHKFYNDDKQLLHIGTLENTSLVDEKNHVIQSHKEYIVRGVQTDKAGNLWLGTTLGLIRKNLHTGEEKIIDAKESSITDILVEKSQDKIWYVTPPALKSYDSKTGVIEKFPYDNGFNNSDMAFNMSLYSTLAFHPDSTIWVGTPNGLLRFSPKLKEFIEKYQNNPSDINSISSNEIKSILPDPLNPQNILWIGTQTGLNKLDVVQGTFTHYNLLHGLPNNTIYGILSDSKYRLWLSTNNGLSVFDIKKETFINFDASNGLQGNEFNTGAFFKSQDGEMFFGGTNGLNRFYPEKITFSNKNFPVNISSVQLMGIDENKHPILSQKEVNHLKYFQNNINITLSSIYYSSPEKISYFYRIVNKDSTWIELGNNRNVMLTNLSPGKYVFQAKCTDPFGRQNNPITELTFRISPPWWNSILAWIVYCIILVGTLLYYWKSHIEKIAEQNKLEIERKQAAAILELDKAKSQFLTNITHEFRTPLTLIKGYVSRMKEHPEVSHLDEIENSSNRLLQLINQLMDLAKIESGTYHLTYQKDDLLKDFYAILESFRAQAEELRITLKYILEGDSEKQLSEKKLIYSKEAFWIILVNLLSNAFKFTPTGGEIIVKLLYQKDQGHIHISVSDTGPGIPEKDIEKIFDRFYQGSQPYRKNYEGSGVGLSLVKELAELHSGYVKASNQSAKGAIFDAMLKEAEEYTHWEDAVYQIAPEERILIEDTIPKGIDLPLILIVDDHPEMRKLIKLSLENEYQYIEAADGKDGWELAQERIPDLIISDVMMPRMDGIEFCHQIKTSELTSHIPIIFLTAKSEQKEKIQGLSMGAVDYLTKPFSTNELKYKVQNNLQTLRILKEKLAKHTTVEVEENVDIAKEIPFLKKIDAIIETHLSDPDFRVETLAAEVFLSTSQLHRKLKAILDISPIQYIRQIRMQRALTILLYDEKSIAEVAMIVGFEDAGYFTRMFKKQFNILPSDKENIRKIIQKEKQI